ncbi:hypothetical protein [[Actinomadura] parvosata]|uniref:hypothetical protein n=1 Tax=[Actinomadura] parvosata TaxID=1955412 RepID=UPI0016469260
MLTELLAETDNGPAWPFALRRAGLDAAGETDPALWPASRRWLRAWNRTWDPAVCELAGTLQDRLRIDPLCRRAGPLPAHAGGLMKSPTAEVGVLPDLTIDRDRQGGVPVLR